ncbi:hypothetical protein EVAR_90464_1, partial [Eumeta japonica]
MNILRRLQLASSAIGGADQHPFHCFAQHREQAYGPVRLRTGIIVLPGFGITFMAATFQAGSIPALGTYLPSLGTLPGPGRSQPGVRREPINAGPFED